MKSKKALLEERRKKPEPAYPLDPEFKRNMPVVLTKLKKMLKGTERVLEIGSDSGYHAVYIAKAMSKLNWQPTGMPEQLTGLNEFIDAAQLKNIKNAEALDISKNKHLDFVADVIYTSNTMHMLTAKSAENLIFQSARILPFKGLLIVYGPFKYNDEHTNSNNRFLDSRIKKINRHRGIRDFEKVKSVANKHSMILKHDFELPLNSHLLVFAKA